MIDLQRWIDTEQPHAITSIDTEEVFPALAEIAARIPVILEVHSPYRENRAYIRWLQAIRLKAFFVPSEFQAGVVRRATEAPAPVFVVPNPLRGIFVSDPQPFKPPPPKPVVAWIGRLDAAKDWHAFLRIGKHISDLGLRAEYWVVGEAQGPAGEERLFRKAKAEGLLASLKWYPMLAHDLVPRLMDAVVASGGALTSTSRSESFGMTIAEGMARGCAVLAPNQGPFREFVEDGVTGLLYEPGREKTAAQLVATVLAGPELRAQLGRRARSAILERHAPEVALRALADALETVVGLTGVAK
jgi:glycosyltransferase involved in cell wall biosynthesis